MEFIVSTTLKKIVFYLLLIYSIVGFVILPLIAKPKIIDLVAQETNAQIEIGTIYFNPFLFKLKLSNVLLKNLQEEELISFEEFYVDFELYSLAKKAIHVDEITLIKPKISLVYNADKSFNLLKILKNQKSKKEENSDSIEFPRVIVDSVDVKDGTLLYQDYTLKTPFTFSFHKIGFELEDLDTQESQVKDAKVRFYATLGDGGFIDFRSKIISLSPFLADGSLNFEASKLYTEWQYLQDMTNLEVADGKISLYTNYHLNLEDKNETKIENLTLQVQKFRLKPKSQHHDMLNIKNFSVKNVKIEPFKQRVEIEKIALDGLGASAVRKGDGTIDWSEYLAMNKEDNSTEELRQKEQIASSPSQPWDLLIQELSLEEINLTFDDKAIVPYVRSRVNELNLYAKNLTLAGEKPFEYNLDVALNDRAECSSQGSFAYKNLDLQASFACQDFDVTHYNPYIEEEAKKALKSYNIELKTLLVDVESDLHLRELNSTYALELSNAHAALNKFQINKKGSQKEFIRFKNFLVDGVHVDTKEKSVTIENASFNNLFTKLEKYKNGSLNIENLIEPKVAEKSQLKSDEQGYSMHLNHFALNNSNFSFEDNSLAKRATNRIENINANIYDIDLKKNSWLKYDIGMSINSKGSIEAKGALRHTPLKHSGSFEVKDLSLIELTPYLQEYAYVSVEDGRLSLKGKSEYVKSSRVPDLRVEGSVALESFFVNETLHNTQLLSFGDVKVNSYTFELYPNRLHVDEVDVSSFYVDAKIDENKTLNFSELVKKSDTNASVEVAKEQSQSHESNSTFPYRVLKVNVALGSAKFADYSIPIKFLTHIHDLNGAIYAISNTPGDTTYVDIDGEVDKYASTSLKGSIDSADPKAYTDLDFNFKNLSLNSLSGYSARFAGHEIDSGKLYLDLGYNILDSQLLGSNSVVIKRIKLGKEVQDENITVLPLGFVIGLLEDSDGVMDIDMPVEGDLENPDFKYGKLLFQTFANLITKAVTSPFKFLSSAMGMDGENLEYIAYEAGSSEISPPQREKLDKISKMMLKKPKILLRVAGKYELQKDTEALQLQKLIELVVQKSGIKNIEDHRSAMSIELLEDIYKESHSSTLLAKLRERLHKKFTKKGAYERVYSSELIILCQEMQTISKSELLMLADARADKIISYLVSEKMIEAQRLTRGASQVIEDDHDAKIIKVDMEIKVK